MDADEFAGTDTGSIASMTWPAVSPGAGVMDDYRERLHAAFGRERGSLFHGRHDFGWYGLAGRLQVSPSEHAGHDCLQLELRMPGNQAGSHRQRTLWLSAEVRTSWLAEVTRGGASRADEAERIIGALVGLALLPGQSTVRIIEDGLSAGHGLVALAGAISVPAP